MENGFSFMPDYPQMASFFMHGETFNQQDSIDDYAEDGGPEVV